MKRSGQHLKRGGVSRRHAPRVPKHKLGYSEKAARALKKRITKGYK